ncbi:MAG: hypothetical protein ABIO99_11440 [Candidatus Limnocylindria bacterium]
MPPEGPALLAWTDTDRPGDYLLVKAVLDLIMPNLRVHPLTRVVHPSQSSTSVVLARDNEPIRDPDPEEWALVEVCPGLLDACGLARLALKLSPPLGDSDPTSALVALDDGVDRLRRVDQQHAAPSRRA